MGRIIFRTMLMIFLGLVFVSAASAQVCVECHKKITPNIVSDWQLSKHNQNKIGCSDCHGDQHKSAQDVAKAKIPTPDTCGACHEARVKQFKTGKHAAAWAAMKAMPTIHWQPMELIEGMKGCGGCHKIGLKTEDRYKGIEERMEQDLVWLPAMPAIHGIPSRSRKPSSHRPVRLATWASITPSGKCIQVLNMEFATCLSKSRCFHPPFLPQPAKPAICREEITAY